MKLSAWAGPKRSYKWRRLAPVLHETGSASSWVRRLSSGVGYERLARVNLGATNLQAESTVDFVILWTEALRCPKAAASRHWR